MWGKNDRWLLCGKKKHPINTERKWHSLHSKAAPLLSFNSTHLIWHNYSCRRDGAGRLPILHIAPMISPEFIVALCITPGDLRPCISRNTHPWAIHCFFFSLLPPPQKNDQALWWNCKKAVHSWLRWIEWLKAKGMWGPRVAGLEPGTGGWKHTSQKPHLLPLSKPDGKKSLSQEPVTTATHHTQPEAQGWRYTHREVLGCDLSEDMGAHFSDWSRWFWFMTVNPWFYTGCIWSKQARLLFL